MLCWQAGAQQGFPVYPGKAGEGLKRYLPPEVWGTLTVPPMSPASAEALFQALSTACQLFTQASRKTAETLGYSWQDRWDEAVPRVYGGDPEEHRRPFSVRAGESFRQIQAHERRKEQEP